MNDKVVAKDSMSASVLGIALPWNTLTWQTDPTLVQQVLQLSPPLQSVFRVCARHVASPAAALNVFAAHAVQLPSGPVYPAGHGALALQSATAVDPEPAVVLPGGQLHDGSCSSCSRVVVEEK